MWNDKHEKVGIASSVEQFWNGDHIFWQLDSWEIFHIFMILIDNLGELTALDHLLVDPHVDAEKGFKRSIQKV